MTVLLGLPYEDSFVRKCRKIYQEINEQSLEDTYEFMSEADMIAAGFDEKLNFNSG